MDKIISAAILILIVWVIVAFLLPLLTGTIHTIAAVVVAVGGIIGLMKIAGMWF